MLRWVREDTLKEGFHAGLSYQWTLRAAGAYLDRDGCREVSIVETPVGLFVGRRVPERANFSTVELTLDELATFRGNMVNRRVAPRPLKAPHGGYQDFLRALGWELDHMSAYSLVLDEVESDFLVTYLYLDASDGHLEKRLSIVDPLERQDLLKKAYARRDIGARLEMVATPVEERGPA
jgi:hypothetical protein